MESFADKLILPKVRHALLNDWDVVTLPVEAPLQVYESLAATISAAKANELLHVVIFPKLKRAAEQWEPQLTRPAGYPRIDLWLQPWLPHLPGEIDALHPAIRRKLLLAVGTCDLENDGEALRDVILPWTSLWGPRASESVSSALAASF